MMLLRSLGYLYIGGLYIMGITDKLHVPLRIGTRASPLARQQAIMVRDILMSSHGLQETHFEIIPISTMGDRTVNAPVGAIGGKGIFVKEIESALIERNIDMAVHSMKDMSTVLPEPLCMAACLPRGDVRDAFISFKYGSLMDMHDGARIGTASLRRQAQSLFIKSDLDVVLLRGNVGGRILKLANKVVDATFLSLCAMQRLSITSVPYYPIEPECMIPAVGQGAIGVEVRKDNSYMLELLNPIHCDNTWMCIMCERAFLHSLNGSCKLPVAGLAILQNNEIWLRGEVLSTDGSHKWTAEECGSIHDAEQIGYNLGLEIRSKILPGILPDNPQ